MYIFILCSYYTHTTLSNLLIASFDICFLNDIAVANSSLLREYSLMDDNVRQLMIVVKRWAKENKIGSAQEHSLSSYAWLNMVVFYLQCLEYVPNLQCPKLMEQLQMKRDPDNYWHNVNNLDTCYLTWQQAQQVWTRPERFEKDPVNITSLLYGFFHFYAISFTGAVSMISIKRGRENILPKTVFRKCSLFFCIEDPFETFDSHCPHDLGIPVNEPQTRHIFEVLQTTEEHLRKALLGNDDVNQNLLKTLWPSQEESQTTSDNNTHNAAGQGGGGGGGNKNRNRKKNKGHGGGGRNNPTPNAAQKGGGANNQNKIQPKAATSTKKDSNSQANNTNNDNKQDDSNVKGGSHNQKQEQEKATAKNESKDQSKKHTDSNDKKDNNATGGSRNHGKGRNHRNRGGQAHKNSNQTQEAGQNPSENQVKPKLNQENVKGKNSNADNPKQATNQAGANAGNEPHKHGRGGGGGRKGGYRGKNKKQQQQQ